jgi:hypothetical protein
VPKVLASRNEDDVSTDVVVAAVMFCVSVVEVELEMLVVFELV